MKSFYSQLTDCVFRKHGLRTSILWRIMRLAVIVVIIVASLISAFWLVRSSTLLKSDYDQQLANYANATSGTVSQWVDLIKDQIRTLADEESFVDGSVTLAERKARLDASAVNTKYKDFSIADMSGKTYNDTDISDREYFTSAKAGNTFVSSPVVRKTDNSLTIMVGSPMHVTGFDGVIYGAISVDFFDEMLNRFNLGAEGFSFMVDSVGTIIAYPDDSYVRDAVNPITLAKTETSYEGFGKLVSAMKSGSTGTMLATMPDGREFRTGYAPIAGNEGWSVAVLYLEDEIEHPFMQLATMGVLITLLLIFIGVVFCLIMGTRISYPLRVGSDALRKMAAGDISTAREETALRGDETEAIIRAFDETKEALNLYIGDIRSVLAGISSGNLDQHIELEYKGDFSDIKESLTDILESLNMTMSTTSEAASNLTAGAAQVEAASQALATASTQQAEAVVEITASMEGIVRTTTESTQNVISVNDLTQTAKSEAADGNDRMQDMIGAMNEISEASQNIAKIMKVIDDIAFQTNILALNASVEAARAGEHGKGFAVVAEEVRNLAGKSAEASAEIAGMIDNSISKIKAGTTIASDTADKLGKIVEAVDKIALIMNDIADASQDQQRAIEQVNTGIEQISKAVQNNSATSEECAAASTELAGQARSLLGQIGFYKLRRS